MERQRLQSILTRLGIPWEDQRTAVNVCCPWCRGQTRGLPDDRFRLGIFLDNLRFHCWRCHRVGGLYEALNEVAGISKTEYRRLVGRRAEAAETTLADRIRARLAEGEPEQDRSDSPACMPPGEPVSRAAKDRPEVQHFLRVRNLSPATCDLYGAIYTGRSGPDAYRVAWPIPAADGTLGA